MAKILRTLARVKNNLEGSKSSVPAPLELEHVMHEVQEQQEDQPVSPATQASSRKKSRRWDTYTPSVSPATQASSRKKSRRWDTYTPSGSEDEMAPRSVNLQSHDPRPESVAMAQWAEEARKKSTNPNF